MKFAHYIATILPSNNFKSDLQAPELQHNFHFQTCSLPKLLDQSSPNLYT